MNILTQYFEDEIDWNAQINKIKQMKARNEDVDVLGIKYEIHKALPFDHGLQIFSIRLWLIQRRAE